MTEAIVAVSPLELFAQADAKTEEARTARSNALRDDSLGRSLYREAEQLRKAAVQAIKDGQSTGDLALDYCILLYPPVMSGPDKESDLYKRLRWLLQRLRRHSGRPIVYGGNVSVGWQVGLVPANGASTCWWDGSNRLQISTTPVGRYPSYQRQLQDRPIELDASSITYHLAENKHSQNLYVGIRQVTDWFSRLSLDERFAAWTLLRRVGWPLEADSELAADIQRRREEMVEKLVQAEAKLLQLNAQFEKWQRNPNEFLGSLPNYRQPHDYIKSTAAGVEIDFKMGDGIAKAEEALRSLADEAAEDLLMQDNATWQRVSALLAPPSSPDE